MPRRALYLCVIARLGWRAAIENLIVGRQHLGMESARIGVEVGARGRFEPEMAVFIRAPHQSRRVASAGELLYRSRQIADREADASNCAAVRLGPVDKHYVMQRHLSGIEDEIDRF